MATFPGTSDPMNPINETPDHDTPSGGASGLPNVELGATAEIRRSSDGVLSIEIIRSRSATPTGSFGKHYPTAFSGDRPLVQGHGPAGRVLNRSSLFKGIACPLNRLS